MHVTDWITDDPGGAGQVIIQWVKQETLLGTTFKRKK
jgi:hypothetical protein